MGAELLVLHLIELEGERFGECGLLPTSDRGSPKNIINTVPIWGAWCMTSGIRCLLVARVGVVWNLAWRATV